MRAISRGMIAFVAATVVRAQPQDARPDYEVGLKQGRRDMAPCGISQVRDCERRHIREPRRAIQVVDIQNSTPKRLTPKSERTSRFSSFDCNGILLRGSGVNLPDRIEMGLSFAKSAQLLIYARGPCLSVRIRDVFEARSRPVNRFFAGLRAT
jgi:hypothetical protein